MKAADFKKFFKNNYNIPVRVRTSKHYINAWIEPDNWEEYNKSLKYNHEFPLELRRKLLVTIYGPVEWAGKGNAGNIRPHSLAFKLDEWERAGIVNSI